MAKEAGEAYLRALQAAGEAYAQRDFTKALEKTDLADQIHPGIPDTWGMRGAIYAEEHDYGKAQEAFEKAAKANPGDFWSAYNLAQLIFMEKQYKEAASAFDKLMVYRGHEDLVEYKIVFADVLAGDDAAAKPVLDSMKFPCDTPAYYFAHAVWGFAHKDVKDGSYYTRAGLKVFGLEKCVPFYDALVGMGWVAARDPKDGSIPEQTFPDQPSTPDSDTGEPFSNSLQATPAPAGGM